jgi:hypothetical protein
VTGSTSSSDFPTTKPLFGALSGGDAGNPYDAFVGKLDASGSALVYATYLGGAGGDYGQGIAVDSSGNAYVTGFTESTDFPTYQGLFGPAADASWNVFVSELNANGSTLVYSTYLGGGIDVSGYGIAVDGSGTAYVTGTTQSTAFPTRNAVSAILLGSSDAFVASIGAGSPADGDSGSTPALVSDDASAAAKDGAAGAGALSTQVGTRSGCGCVVARTSAHTRAWALALLVMASFRVRRQASSRPRGVRSRPPARAAGPAPPRPRPSVPDPRTREIRASCRSQPALFEPS